MEREKERWIKVIEKWKLRIGRVCEKEIEGEEERWMKVIENENRE